MCLRAGAPRKDEPRRHELAQLARDAEYLLLADVHVHGALLTTLAGQDVHKITKLIKLVVMSMLMLLTWLLMPLPLLPPVVNYK